MNTLTHRAKTVCSTSQSLKKDEDHIRQALQNCKYPSCILNRAKIKYNPSNPMDGSNNTENNSSHYKNKNMHIVVPYSKRQSESCKNICSEQGIQMHFKGGKTIRDLLVIPKVQGYHLHKGGTIYRYKCGRVHSKEKYIGESDRAFGKGVKNT